jgi:acylphosphatase
VQGVSFRWHTREEAGALGLTGWVRNLPDGSVEVLAEGEQAPLEALARWVAHGPPHARVDHVDARWTAAEGGLPAPFAIRR